MKAKYYPCYVRGGGCCCIPEDYQTVTYEGAMYSEEELLRINNLYRTKGYYAAREFYQPDEIEMHQAVYGNLKLMKKVLTPEQYRKYVT